VRRARTIARALLAGALGAAAALLVSCSGSSGGLIPLGNAGPLKGDFEAVAFAATHANGDCSETESALTKTELDFDALPASVNSELRATLRQGIANLKVRAKAACEQPVAQPTTATTETTPPTTTETTPPTQTETTPPEEESKGGEGGDGGGPGGEGPPGKEKGKGDGKTGGLEAGE
jgi:hypothetical protein